MLYSRPVRIRRGREGRGAAGFTAAALFLLAGCVPPHRLPEPMPVPPSGLPPGKGGAGLERGIASWYGPGFHGNRTASGERYDMDAMTAAHRTLPFDTHVEVRNLDNGRRAILRVNDRGPFVQGRILDCSRAGARELGFEGAGLARVELSVLGRSPENPPAGGGPEAEPALAPVDPQKGPFDVQVGAFTDHENARRLEERLLIFFPQVHLVSFQEFLRVRVGPYEDLEQAEEALRVAGYQGLEGWITRHDPQERLARAGTEEGEKE